MGLAAELLEDRGDEAPRDRDPARGDGELVDREGDPRSSATSSSAASRPVGSLASSRIRSRRSATEGETTNGGRYPSSR
jgi:hypothetical protein